MNNMNNVDKARYFIKKAAVHSYLKNKIRDMKLEKIAGYESTIRKTPEESIGISTSGLNSSSKYRRGKHSWLMHNRRIVDSRVPKLDRYQIMRHEDLDDLKGLEDILSKSKHYMEGINSTSEYPFGTDFDINEENMYHVDGPLIKDDWSADAVLGGKWDKRNHGKKDMFRSVFFGLRMPEVINNPDYPQIHRVTNDIEELYQEREKINRFLKKVDNDFRRAHAVNEDPMSDRAFAQWYGNTPDSDPEKKRLNRVYGKDYFKKHPNAWMKNR